MIRTYQQMLTPDEHGAIETGANVTLTVALAALIITAQLERIAKALEERNALDRRI